MSKNSINTLRKSLQPTSASPYRTQVQLTASFLVFTLIFIEYKRAYKKRQKQDLLNKVSLFDRLSCSCLPYLRVLVPLSYTFQVILSTENWKFQALKYEW